MQRGERKTVEVNDFDIPNFRRKKKRVKNLRFSSKNILGKNRFSDGVFLDDPALENKVRNAEEKFRKSTKVTVETRKKSEKLRPQFSSFFVDTELDEETANGVKVNEMIRIDVSSNEVSEIENS